MSDILQPSYFPAQDAVRVDALYRHNFSVLEEDNEQHKDLLWPAGEPELIGQTHFGLSESAPLTISGIGPCLGVILYDRDEGHALAAHLEAREEDVAEQSSLYMTRTMEWLFDRKPTEIHLISILGGASLFHEVTKYNLEESYKMNIPDYTMSGSVTIDPRIGTINKRFW